MANQPKKYKKFVATAATATLVASAIVPVASAASFSDVPENNEFAPYIDALTEAGIINGYPSTNTFKPGAALTRGQVVKMLGRWVESNGVEIPSDWNTKARFTDVPTNHKDQELVKYAALVADEGVFGGAAGKLMAGNNITRQQMAKVLNGAYAAVNGESLIEIAEGVDNVRIPDLASARAEFEDAIQALMDLEISSTNSGNFRPLENVTRAQFSKFLYNTINFEASDVAPFEIKAVNSTTVEVIFDQDIENIDKVKFAIEGLDIKGAVVKQTSKRTAVLTTSEQKGGTEYTVTVDGEKAGTFVGIAAVVPTAIDVNTKSVQGVIGEEVTLTATVKVPEGQSKEGVSVTFNIVNDKTTNDKVEVEAFTNAEGVATYKYTRYYSSTDSVTAYATKKSSVYSSGKVYWANAAQLTVKDITEGATLVNGAKKVYEINSKDNANGYVFVAFEENLNVAPNTAVTGAKVEGLNTYVLDSAGKLTATTNVNGYPYAYTTGGKAVTAVKLDNNGKANLVVTGSNATVTPIVYSKGFVDATKTLVGVDAEYGATLLQAKASTVKFELKHELGLTIKAEGVQNAATYLNSTETGGRDYTVTYTDKDGKVAAPGTKVKVAIDTKGINGTLHVLDTDNKEVAYTTSAATPGIRYYEVAVEKEGKAAFTVASTNVNDYVAPVVFIDNGKATSNGALDADDLQAQGEITYFVADVTFAAELSALDAAGKPVKAVVANGVEYAEFVYSLVDQNGKPRRSKDGNATTVSFEVKAGTGVVTVNGNEVLQPGATKTINATIPSTGTKASVRVVAQNPSSVSVSATGSRAGVVLPTTNPASVTVDFSQYGTAEVTGYAKSVNTALDVLSINNVVYNYANAVYKQNGNVIDIAAFESLIVGNNAYVSITKDSADKFTFNVIPAPGQTVVNTAKATSATNLDITFTSTPVVTDGTQFWVDHDDDTSTPMVAGTVAAVNGKVVSVTYATDTFTKADIGEVQYIPSATLANRLTLDGVRADNTITISDANTTSAIVVAGNPSTFGAGTLNTFVAGAKAVKQTEVLTIAAQPSTSGNLRVNLTDKDGVVLNDLITNVVNGDAVTTVASKVATLLQSKPEVTAKYDVTLGTGVDADKVTLTAKNPANDDTALVLSVNSDTATIATQTSTDGLAGVATSVAQIVDVPVTGTTNATSPVEPVTVAINQVSADLGNFSLTKTVNVTNTSTTASLASSIVSALNSDAAFSARFVASVSPIDATQSTIRITNKATGVVTSTTFTITP